MSNLSDVEMNSYLEYINFGVEKILEKIRSRDFIKRDNGSKLYMIYLFDDKLFVELNEISTWGYGLNAYYAPPISNIALEKIEKWDLVDRGVGFIVIDGYSSVYSDVKLSYCFSHELAHHYFFKEVFDPFIKLYFKMDELEKKILLSKGMLYGGKDEGKYRNHDKEMEIYRIKNDLIYDIRELQRKILIEIEEHAIATSLLYFLNCVKENTCTKSHASSEINKILYNYNKSLDIVDDEDLALRVFSFMRAVEDIFDYFKEESTFWNYIKNFIANPYRKDVNDKAELAMKEVWSKIERVLERSKEIVRQYRFDMEIEKYIYELERWPI